MDFPQTAETRITMVFSAMASLGFWLLFVIIYVYLCNRLWLNIIDYKEDLKTKKRKQQARDHLYNIIH